LVVHYCSGQIIGNDDIEHGGDEVIDAHVAQCGLTVQNHEQVMPQADLNRMRS
jgi:hypothetical protein